MKLNRRSFIQKTLATLAAMAAGLRGVAVAAMVDEEVPYMVGQPALKSARPLGILPSGLRIVERITGWPQEMHDDCIVDVRQFVIDELESA